MLRPITQTLEIVIRKVDDFLGRIRPYQLVITTAVGVIVIYRIRRIWRASDKPILKRLYGSMFNIYRHLPYVRDQFDDGLEKLRCKLEYSLRKADKQSYFRKIPEYGYKSEQIDSLLGVYFDEPSENVREGKISGAVYVARDEEHLSVIEKVYVNSMYMNPLHPDVFPGCRKMEAEVIRMACDLYHGDEASCGTLTSGGTESILLAMLAYRNQAFSRGILDPEILVPVTAHAAFDKAAGLFGMRIRHIAIDGNGRVNIRSLGRAITRKTCVIVGSAPNFPTGTMDDIEGIANLGSCRGVPVHVDACLGGFLIPFMNEAGFPVPLFDFRLKGVTSISCDTHKYGYAPKGSSVIMYRSAEYLHHQYMCFPEWTGGLYATPTLAGSRNGASIAVTWATLIFMGRAEYVRRTKEIIRCCRKISRRIQDEVDGLELLGSPDVCVVAFTSRKFNIYEMIARLAERRWNLNALQNPPGAHYCVTMNTVNGNAVESFINDLKTAARSLLEESINHEASEMAAIYGLVATIPDKSLIDDACYTYLDACYSIPSADK